MALRPPCLQGTSPDSARGAGPPQPCRIRSSGRRSFGAKGLDLGQIPELILMHPKA